MEKKKNLHPLWSIKRKQKRVYALNTIVGEEMDISDVDTTVNDITSTTTNDQSGNRISNTSSSTNFPHKSPSTKLKRMEEHRLAMSLIVFVIVFVICWLPFHTRLTMYICRPFQYDCTSRWPYELVLVALRSVKVSLRCVLVTMEMF